MKQSDTYTISSSTHYSEHDKLILNLLYQPLISYKAVSLYNLLWSESQFNKPLKDTTSHFTRLCNTLEMGMHDIQMQCDKLIAIGLIDLYQKDKTYHFILKAPSKAENFLKNPLLSNNLFLILGKDEYEKTCFMFGHKKFKNEDYTPIKKTFKDVFEPPRLDHIQSYRGMSFTNESRAVVHTNMNEEALKIGLQAFNLDHLLVDHVIKQYIAMLNTAYTLSIDQLVESIVFSYSENSLDLEKLEKIIKDKYNFNIQAKDYSRVNVNPQSSNDIYGSNSVMDFLENHFSSYKITPENMKKIDHIMKETNIRPSFMNIIIEYVIKKNKYINTSYIASFASTISQSDYTYDQQVRDYFNRLNTKKDKAKGSYTNTTNQPLGKANSDLYDKEVVEPNKDDQADVLDWLKERGK